MAVNTADLDRYEAVLEDGLVKICKGAGLLREQFMRSEDIDGKWEQYAQDYVADAVLNFNEYPEAAIAWAGFLGMAVAHNWDVDWEAHKDDPYKSYYGSRGWDDMDEHILWEVLALPEAIGKKLSDTLDSCTLAALGLIRHEGIEAQTELGFYVLVRTYSVLYRIGAAIELQRLGYQRVRVA